MVSYGAVGHGTVRYCKAWCQVRSGTVRYCVRYCKVFDNFQEVEIVREVCLNVIISDIKFSVLIMQ